MPAIFDMRPQPVFAGMVCDVCDESFGNRCFDFHFCHVFGYGSKLGGDQVEVAICDPCLEKIIKDHVPGAKWTILDEWVQSEVNRLAEETPMQRFDPLAPKDWDYRICKK